MANLDRKSEVFEFVWKIENFDGIVKNSEDEHFSPSFTSNLLLETSWHLSLVLNETSYPDGFGIYLYRSIDCSYDGDVVVECQFSILKAGKFDCKFELTENQFEKGTECGHGESKIMELSKLLEEKNVFLPNNTLTVRCLIWLTKENGPKTYISAAEAASKCIYGEDLKKWHSELIPEEAANYGIEELKRHFNPSVNSCTAISCIGVERVNFEWSFVKFCDWKTSQKHTFPVKSACDRSKYLMFALSLTEEENVVFTIYKKKDSLEKFLSVNCKVSISGITGQFEEATQKEFYFEKNAEQAFVLELPLKKNEIVAESISPDVRFRFEFAFSTGKIVANEIVESSTSPPKKKMKFSSHAETSDQKNFKNLFLEQKYCDVVFLIGDEEIAAHMAILANRSEVLNTMFSTEMKDKDHNVVELGDIDAETFKCMLMFMYSDTVSDDTIGVEETIKLYAACHKFQFWELFKKCSKFLVQNLDFDNACENLSLADEHSDGFLKSSAIEFVCKHANVVLGSDQWKALVEKKVPLASEVLQKMSLGFIR